MKTENLTEDLRKVYEERKFWDLIPITRFITQIIKMNLELETADYISALCYCQLWQILSFAQEKNADDNLKKWNIFGTP